MLSIQTLGGISVTLADARRPAPAALQPRRLALLAILARAGTRGVSRDRLMAMCWPDATDEAGRRAITQALYGLRSGLDAPELLLGTQELRLDPEHVQCDLWSFEAAIAERRYEDAVSVYRGPFLDGFRLPNAPEFERWVDETSRALADRYDVALERLARAAEDRGQPLAAAGWWRKRLVTDPLSARVTVQAVRALVAADDVNAARAQVRVYGELVRTELSSDPDPSVEKALVDALADRSDARASGPSAPLPLPAPPSSTQPAPDAAMPPAEYTPHSEYTEGARRSTSSRSWRVSAVMATLAVGVVTASMAAMRYAAHETHLQVELPTHTTWEEGLELDPAISPNGLQIAYAGGRPGPFRLLLRQRDGGRAVELAPAQRGDQRRPRWAPDGSRLLYQAGRGIWMVPALGGLPREIVPAPADTAAAAEFPAWSADGTAFAYVVADSLIVSDIDGKSRRVAHTGVALHSPAWSPDGEWIAVVDGNREFLYGAIGNLAPNEMLLVPSHCELPRERCAAMVKQVGTPNTLHMSPEWRDRRQLLFVTQRGGSRDLYLQMLDEAGTPDGAASPLTSGANLASFSIAADGRTIAYSALALSANVWSVPLVADGTPARVTSGSQTVEGLDVSLDGRWLAFDANRTGQQDIFVLPLEHGRATATDALQVVDSPDDDFHPSWSADGQWITYYRYRDGVPRAAVVSAKGGVSQFPFAIRGTDGERSPVWRVDDRALIYWRWRAGRFELFESPHLGNLRFGMERQITRAGGLGPTFTADGQMVYFRRPGELWQMPVDGDESQARRLYPAGGTSSSPLSVSSARITPDGARLIARASDGAKEGFWIIPIPVGTPRLIVRTDDSERPSPRLEFATDGRYLYFTRQDRAADVWTARLSER